MTKLKTLKDMNRAPKHDIIGDPISIERVEIYTTYFPVKEGNIILKDELKAEAVKRYKHFEAIRKSVMTYETDLLLGGRLDEIREMYNLNEEDLQ